MSWQAGEQAFEHACGLGGAQRAPGSRPQHLRRDAWLSPALALHSVLSSDHVRLSLLSVVQMPLPELVLFHVGPFHS